MALPIIRGEAWEEIRAVYAENSGIAIRVHRNRDRKAWVSVETGETMFGGVSRGSGMCLGPETHPVGPGQPQPSAHFSLFVCASD